ncbi:uncharacterized protein LOC132045867 [Lycium ferocissimum]|uniref:uncharacterized protein LOC132045867 n=1 Tax=Lycium ferocissimum TaxID=112874 RepID=UPI00281566AC|nr:uncharacterized protein LOC132045867 [Lycium ferocissimum]
MVGGDTFRCFRKKWWDSGDVRQKILERRAGGGCAVYASCDIIIRRELWLELTSIRSLCDGPWVVCGDVNVTRYPNERSECQRITGAMTEFTDWINEMELFDPPLFGGSFTWRRGDNHMTASRIDRFVYSHQWEELFTQIKQDLLPRLYSDHNPIMLSCRDLSLKKSYFKFEQWWMGAEGFRDKVKEWWISFSVTGTGSFILATKLKMLKDNLKVWGLENMNNWKQKKEDVLHQLSSLEEVQEQRILTEDELLQKIHLSMEFEEIS